MRSRLARGRWLAPIVPGRYELIPAERGDYAFPDTNPLFIGSTLVRAYYLSWPARQLGVWIMSTRWAP